MGKVIHSSGGDILRMVQQLRALYQRKRPPRSDADNASRDGARSVFGHTYSLHFLARHFAKAEGLSSSLDIERVSNIIAYRDVSDVSGDGNHGAGHAKECKERKRRAAAEAFRRLPEEMRGLALSAWEDFEEKKSLEARFVGALVKLEPCLGLNDPVDESPFGRLERKQLVHETYEEYVHEKLEAANEFPIMRRFVLAIADLMLSRGLFQKSPR